MSTEKRVSFYLVFALICSVLVSACGGTVTMTATDGSKVLNVVAAENFYGDIIKQLGGEYVNVTSIMADPNVDPHDYQSNFQDTRAVGNADLIIENGASYDTWIDKLLASSANQHGTLLVAANIADHKLPDNPHVWYGIDNIQTIAKSMTASLKKLDRAHAAMFTSNLTKFQQALAPIEQKIKELQTKYSGTPVGLTETIYLYQTRPLGLKVLTPFEFEKAVAEGNDPPADTVTSAVDQVNKKLIKVLIYNEQTNTTITSNLRDAATHLGIPVVPVTETMPSGKTYQTWMMGQLNTLQQGLAAATGR